MNIFNNRNPKINRITGYVIFFIGLILFCVGSVICNSGNNKALGTVLRIVGVLIIAVSVIWMVKKVRCPHCNAVLHFKLYPISQCPYCGQRTDDIE